ncbi:probable linoleate 9S-lipoxygenase 5 [Rutidosis leptorrhynchoides]|uniref:probable linoleate 9S-lipoxygenase 5 n=1 Tax=Rutidosis leptorrhynchoides TaxID=125765 RepID=UPI003A9A3951
MENIFRKVANCLLGDDNAKEKTTVKGKVVLMKKNRLDFNDVGASVIDQVQELLGRHIYIQLISITHAGRGSSENGLRGKLGKKASVEDWVENTTPVTIVESTYEITFDWDLDFGLPGAFLIQNHHHNEFFLMTLTLENVPDHGQLHFVCNSWVYPTKRYTKDRIFFANKAYLPSDTPKLLRPYREEEMAIMRGNGTGMREEWDRVYDYAFYNDLGDPDNDEDQVRPVIGGSSEYPYPRRCRTGRPPSKSDPETESRLSLTEGSDIYVPRDERFGHLKSSDFLAYGLEAILKFILPEFEALTDDTFDEFDSFDDILNLYIGGIKLPEGPLLDNLLQNIPFEIFKELIRSDGGGIAKYSTPKVIQADLYAWSTDEEFARETLAGVNPVSIQLLKEFPPKSKLDVDVYGNQNSAIRSHHIEEHLDGIQVDEVLEANKLFILDHHDSLMPYVKKINATSSKIYATRTLLLLQKDGTLKPIAIELSLPHPDDDKLGAISKVCTPAKDGVEATIWKLAKAYVTVNDSGVHQLISHWLNTHAVIEPFVIATNRQLSVLHPINKLLHPHFRDTMNINATARNILINSQGILERSFFTGKYSIEMSSKIYKNWVFQNHAHPTDLVLRGMAVEDSSYPHGLRLLIEDYPYAVDGLEIWSAIKTWVNDYCKFYYKNDEMVQSDNELQSWWKEVREEGHGDLKDEPWWPKMDSIQDVIDNCTTIIWISSALHAAVNFGQYPYAGYPPNRPTLTRRHMPEPNTPEYDELKEDPEKAFLKTVTPQVQSLLSITLIEILSRHTSDEIYLGQRECPKWTLDAEPLKAFENFGVKLKEIEERIMKMNEDESLKNRHGELVKIPYTLLCPNSEEGLTGRGIPNSVSI